MLFGIAKKKLLVSGMEWKGVKIWVKFVTFQNKSYLLIIVLGAVHYLLGQ